MKSLVITAKVRGQVHEAPINAKLATFSSKDRFHLDIDFYHEPHEPQPGIFKFSIGVNPKIPADGITDAELGEIVRLLLEACGVFIDEFRFHTWY